MSRLEKCDDYYDGCKCELCVVYRDNDEPDDSYYDSFYGGSSPQTMAERVEAARDAKYGGRR